jgi:hypothetical protein
LSIILYATVFWSTAFERTIATLGFVVFQLLYVRVSGYMWTALYAAVVWTSAFEQTVEIYRAAVEWTVTDGHHLVLSRSLVAPAMPVTPEQVDVGVKKKSSWVYPIGWDDL